MTTKKILLSAGEISGDKYGAALVDAIKSQAPSIEFAGMGSKQMEASGVRILADLTKQSTIGFIEPIRYLPKIFNALSILKTWMKHEKPDVVVLIDFQGFNLMLAKAAKRLHIPVVYFISPQEWQWGTEAGGKKVAECTDLILSIFEQEVPFYKNVGANPIFIGHPLGDIAQSDVKTDDQKRAFKQVNQLDESRKIVSVFPGSRAQEITHTWPVLAQAAVKLQALNPDIQLVVSVASESLKVAIESSLDSLSISSTSFSFYEGSPYDLMAAAYLSLAASGTVTLEHLFMKTPCVAAYKLHPISYWIGRQVMGKAFDERVKYIAIPNQLAKKKIMPEFLQEQCTPEHIVNAAQQLLDNKERYEALVQDFEKTRQTVYKQHVIQRAATQVLQVVE